MDVSWLQDAAPEARICLLFLINNGNPIEYCEDFREEYVKDASAAQKAAIKSLQKNTIEHIDNNLKERVCAILSLEIKSVPRGTPFGEYKTTKDEIDFLVFNSACKYLDISVPFEDTDTLDVLYRKLSFSEKEIETLLPLDAEKLQYIEVARELDNETVWNIWKNIQNDTEVFDSVITLRKPKSEVLKEALFFMIVRQLQIKEKINRVYTDKLVTILKKCKVNNTIIDIFRSYPQTVKPSGFCIIFCVNEDRKGAEVEIKKVTKIFQNLGFIVHAEIDPELKDIENMKAELSKPKYLFYSSLVCWFISHGNSENIKLKDGLTGRHNLLQMFTKLKNFNKKPKIIFMASCLGERQLTIQSDPKGVFVESDASKSLKSLAAVSWAFTRANDGYLHIPDSSKDITTVHNEMDRLVAYSTLANHSAFRSIEKGSVYVDRVCNLLKQEENHCRNITEVLEETAQELHQILFFNEDNVSNMNVKQGSRYESTLQKTFRVPCIHKL